MANHLTRGTSHRELLKLVVLVVLVAVLVACTSGTAVEAPAEAEAPADVEPTTAPAAEPDTEVTTIRMITHWSGEDAHTESMQLLYDRFEAANPDIKLDIVEIPDWGQANTKVATECGAGNCPNVAFDGFNNTEVIDAGLVYDTEDFVEAHKDIIDFAYMGGKYQDKYWKAFPEEISGFGAVYNKELLAEIGFEEFPKTWDELLAAGEAVQAQGKVLTTLHAYWPQMFGFVQQSTPEGNQASIDGDWGSPTWLETMKRYEELVPYLGPDELELTDATAPLKVLDGDMLFYVDGQWMIGNTGLEPAEAAEKLGVAPFPTPSGQTIGGWNGNAIGNTVYVHADDPKSEEAAWRFLEFWITDEEVIKSFITDAQSPLGVRTDLITPELAGDFLPLFITATSEADLSYAEVGEWSAVDIWGGVLPGFEALITGSSAEEATQIMLDIFRAQ